MKHYFIYKTTHITTGRYYIGKHITKDVNDNYFGSGKYIKQIISVEGVKNLDRVILAYGESKEQLRVLESIYINNKHLNDDLCLNKIGGSNPLKHYKNSYKDNAKKTKDNEIKIYGFIKKEDVDKNDKSYNYVFTKYRFKGLPLLVLSDDNKFYRLPYENNGRNYELKKLKVHYHQGQNKLLYNGKRWIQSDLDDLKYNHKELLKKDKKQFYIPKNLVESELGKILNTF